MGILSVWQSAFYHPNLSTMGSPFWWLRKLGGTRTYQYLLHRRCGIISVVIQNLLHDCI